MALTVVEGTHGMVITFDAATAFDITDYYENGVTVDSMEFIPTATDDKLIVTDTVAAGREMFNCLAATAYDNKFKYFPGPPDRRDKPYVAAANVSSGVKLIIEFK